MARPSLAKCTRYDEGLRTLPLMTQPNTKNCLRAVPNRPTSIAKLQTLSIYVNDRNSKKQMTIKIVFKENTHKKPKQVNAETDLLKNRTKFTFFHIVEGKLKHAILCISILSKQIKSGLVQIKPHKPNIARQTPKTFKKSYSVLSLIRQIPGQILTHNKLKSCCKIDAKRRIAKLKLRIPATKLSLGGRHKKRENRNQKPQTKLK